MPQQLITLQDLFWRAWPAQLTSLPVAACVLATTEFKGESARSGIVVLNKKFDFSQKIMSNQLSKSTRQNNNNRDSIYRK